jgi:hypothetical protein
MSGDVLGRLKQAQRAWARERGVRVDEDGYCHSCDDNFFEPLSACSRRDFDRGSGTELGKKGGRGKIQALHSSAALACNVFDYWRGRDLDVLREALAVRTRLCGIAFEQKFPTSLGGIAPNLDVVLFGCDGSLVAIESKFTEPFVKSKSKCFLKPAYFPLERRLWSDAGLPGCQGLAEGLRDGRIAFETLDAAQLLKHMLGLASGGQPWTLICLWFAPGGGLSDRHAGELAAFSAALGQDSERFRAVTYQALVDRLLRAPAHGRYAAYLRDRYFAADRADEPASAEPRA